MISNKRILIIQLHAYACASDLFACMLNPEYRGSNFKWNKLSSMVIGRVSTSLFMSGCEVKNKQEESFLKTTVESICKSLIETSGVKD